MSRARIDDQQLLTALRNETKTRGRPITAAELAQAYHRRTGKTFSSDSFTQRLERHLEKQTVSRITSHRGHHYYGPARDQGDPLMPGLRFSLEDLKPLIEHAKNAPKHSAGYSDAEPEPALFLVKDQGVYLMSNGEPGLLNPTKETLHQVVYAKGVHPKNDPDWYDTSIALTGGGDDFAETITIAEIEKLIQPGDTTLVILMNATSYTVRTSDVP